MEPEPGTKAWYAQVNEDIIEPDRPIIDPHHHLWSGWDRASKPATSDALVNAQKRYYLHTIECFGVERCMFESNFPVDKFSISYAVLWNAFKKMVGDFSEDEKQALFYGTASRVYRL